jgi:hypothetical protein
MLSLRDHSLFIDSTDSNVTESSDHLRIDVTDPITVTSELNQLHLGLRSFTFTNLIYNVQASDYLTFYIVYNYPGKTSFSRRADVFLDEGQYSASQISAQWALQQTTPGDPLNSTVLEPSNYTVTNLQNPEILPNLNYLERSGKLSFSFGDDDITSFEIPQAQIGDDINYPMAPTPTEIFIPINKNTEYLAYRLGLYKYTDVLTETTYDSSSGILIDLSWSRSVVTNKYKFQLDSLTRKMDHLYQEQSIQFVDIYCDQINSHHLVSGSNRMYPEGILGRVPILAGFNQTQSVFYDEIMYTPISMNNVAALQFSLENPYSSAPIFRAPIQFEVVIHEEQITLPDLTSDFEEQTSYDPPVTQQSQNNTDYLDSSGPPASSTSNNSFQMPSNKRTRYPSFF